MSSSALGDRFRQLCRDNGRSVAIQATEGDVTFEEIGTTRDVIRTALRDLRVEPGTAVVSLVGNHPVFFSAMIACVESGAALVPLGDATDAEALSVIQQAGAVAVITDRKLLMPVAGQRALTPRVSLLRLVAHAGQRSYPPSVVLKLTSGSTHLPKAAIASETNLVNDCRHIIEAMGIGPDDINFGCIPLSHSYAIGNIVMPLLWQGSRVVLRQTFSPSQFLTDVSASGATIFPGVPFMFDRMKSAGIEKMPSCLRLLITAGAPIDANTVSWFRARLDRKVHSFYGSSETGGITYDDSDDVLEPLNVGRPMPETVVSVREPVDEGRAGRIFVSGNAVTSGYANSDEDESDSMFLDGGFLTEDLGYTNDAGHVVLKGRASHLVNVSGRKVDPAEVQRKLLNVPGIADAHVMGVPCDTRGQELVAFLVRTDTALTPITIRQRCAETLSAHKIPRQFVFIDRFPVNARGKIDRQALQRLASSGTGG